jgi:hypothetical protein
MGQASSAAGPERRRTGAWPWQPDACWSSPPARWPTQPRRLPPPQPRQPSMSPSLSPGLQPAGLPVPPPPPQPAQSPTGVAKGGVGASPGRGVPRACPSRSQRSAPPTGGHGEAVRRRPRSASASSCPPRPSPPPRRRLGGPSWPPRCGQKSVRIPRCSRPLRHNIAPWHRVCAGASIPRLAARCGWSKPHGLPRWPCAPSWGGWGRR